MFTGIIEEVGQILRVEAGDASQTLSIGASKVLEGSRLGDSMAVDGACLTLTEMASGSFSVGIMAESLRRTNLELRVPGDAVNLERPVQPTSRLGGHFVQGHVDGTGSVRRVTPEGAALAVWIDTSAPILRYVVEKGFIAIDGVSLTVTGVDQSGFGIALVEYTQQHVNSRLFTVGQRVNLEVDILAKYVEKLVVH